MFDLIEFDSKKQVESITGWYWPKDDRLAWMYIKEDWEDHHKQNICDYINAAGKQFNTVVQAGGNCGMYPRLLSTMFNTVYTFEPDSTNFIALNLNCPQSNIVKIQAAVGEHSSIVSVVPRVKSNVGMHQVENDIDGIIPMLPIDSFQFNNVDLLWLDLEGYEPQAIAGAINTIQDHNPLIFAEYPNINLNTALESVGYELIGQSGYDGIYFTKRLF